MKQNVPVPVVIVVILVVIAAVFGIYKLSDSNRNKGGEVPAPGFPGKGMPGMPGAPGAPGMPGMPGGGPDMAPEAPADTGD